MLEKVVLAVSALVFVSYGIACLVNPGLPVGYAGLTIVTGDGYAEIGAMYGGLQTALGLVCLLAYLRPAYGKQTLALLLLTIGSLALARLYSILSTDLSVTAYSWGAFAYEALTATLAGIALQQSGRTRA